MKRNTYPITHFLLTNSCHDSPFLSGREELVTSQFDNYAMLECLFHGRPLNELFLFL